MSVATHLGLSDPDEPLLRQARQSWPDWQETHPALQEVRDLVDLPAWLRTAHPAEADEVLHVLARLASPREGDDVAAAGVLSWVLLPGACTVAHRLSSFLGPVPIDELVAAQLWLEVRGFPWERLHKVAANIVMNTRKNVLRDLGIGEEARRADPAWARSVMVGPPGGDLWDLLGDRAQDEDTADVELHGLLTWAVDEGVLRAADRDLLVRLALVADVVGVSRRGGQGGLCSREVALTVAREQGVAPVTVRRRAVAGLRALQDAARLYASEVAA